MTNKYITCKPNYRHKPTAIEKGDLIDEVEMCRKELTRAQNRIRELQIKLMDSSLKTLKVSYILF